MHFWPLLEIDVWRQWASLVLEVYSMMMTPYPNFCVCKVEWKIDYYESGGGMRVMSTPIPYIPAKFIFNGDGKAWQHITLMSILSFALDLWWNIVAISLRRVGRTDIQCVRFASLCHHFQFVIVGAVLNWRIQFSIIFWNISCDSGNHRWMLWRWTMLRLRLLLFEVLMNGTIVFKWWHVWYVIGVRCWRQLHGSCTTNLGQCNWTNIIGERNGTKLNKVMKKKTVRNLHPICGVVVLI